jgi:hypothetical protein
VSDLAGLDSLKQPYEPVALLMPGFCAHYWLKPTTTASPVGIARGARPPR